MRFGYVAEDFPLIYPVNSDNLNWNRVNQPTLWQDVQTMGKGLRIFSQTTSIASPVSEIDRLIRQELIKVFNQTKPVCFLSGGIDSPLIAAIAQSMSNEKLKAFTFSTEDVATDETAAASAYAQAFDMEHHLVRLDESQLTETILELSKTSALPLGDYSVIPTYLVCKAAAEYSDTILSGDGGDELFWGYASRMARVINLSHLFRFPKWFRKLRWWTLHRPYEWNPRYFDTVGEWYQSVHEHNFESWLKGLFPGLPPLPSTYQQYDFDGAEPDKTAFWVRWNEFSGHMKAGIDKVVSASEAAGIEVASPLLSQPVIDLASQLDWRICLDPDNVIGKLPLRQLLAKYCSFQTDQKKGFGSPMRQWLSGPLRELFEETVLNRTSLGGLEIDRPKMRSLFEDQLKGTTDRSWGLWIFLSLALWEDQQAKELG